MSFYKNIAGLIAYFPFNGDTRDYSGYNQHGTDTNIKVSRTVNDIAAYFDGTAKKAFTTCLGLTNASDFTLSARTVITAELDATYNQYGFFTMEFATNRYVVFAYQYNSGNRRIQFDWGGSSSPSYYITLVLNRPYMVTMTKAGNAITLYLDGKQVATATTGSVGGSGANTLGIGGYGASGYFVRGEMSDVRVYDRNIGAAEILNLYQGTKPNLLRKIGSAISVAINKTNFFHGW